jgi:hypothetical protein
MPDFINTEPKRKNKDGREGPRDWGRCTGKSRGWSKGRFAFISMSIIFKINLLISLLKSSKILNDLSGLHRVPV